MLQRVNETSSKLEDGALVIHRYNKNISFYRSQYIHDKRVTTYISKNDTKLISDLAYKKYIRNIKTAIYDQVKVLGNFLSKYEPQSIYTAYDKLPDHIKEYVSPYVLSDAEFLEEWLNTPYVGLDSMPTNSDFITDKGECVRSKSELFIANKLYSMNIPYKYEHPLLLECGSIVYPDFTILDVEHRRELYLEHFGMMDNPEYCEKAIRKIDEYARNGLFVGDRLFLTLESSNVSGYIATLETMIHTIISNTIECHL